MDLLTIFLLSLIEGVTEFLPISSTGHLILVSEALGLNSKPFTQHFNIIIQFGAIGAVLALYWRQFFPIRPQFYLKILVAFMPAAIIGLLWKSKIELLLDQVWVVGLALIIGGVAILKLDPAPTSYTPKQTSKPPKRSIATLSWQGALTLGFVQCLAFIPGVSRSAATILGGLGLGFSRKEATEFSFFLGAPTLMAASLYKAYKAFPELEAHQIKTLALGTVLSFVFALISIKFLLHVLTRKGLRPFAYYRIALGTLVLAYVYFF